MSQRLLASAYKALRYVARLGSNSFRTAGLTHPGSELFCFSFSLAFPFPGLCASSGVSCSASWGNPACKGRNDGIDTNHQRAHAGGTLGGLT